MGYFKTGYKIKGIQREPAKKNNSQQAFFKPRRHSDTEVHGYNLFSEPPCRCASVVQIRLSVLIFSDYSPILYF
jgi:hypothetical protein